MIDTSLFGADIPAGTYAAGDIIPLGIVDGPAVVRSGRGAAKLKKITVGQLSDASGAASWWKIHVKNSDWIDSAISLAVPMRGITALDARTGSIQRGHDCDLTQNSAWEVYAECIDAATTTVANSVFALIDIDYPAVSSIVSPDDLYGVPASIQVSSGTIPIKAAGTLVGSSANVVNVDVFKAGYEYALEKLETTSSTVAEGFISISGAAGMNGLKRIMTFTSNPACIREKIEYASKLVKGPMDIGINAFANGGTATTGTINAIFDFVKRRV